MVHDFLHACAGAFHFLDMERETNCKFNQSVGLLQPVFVSHPVCDPLGNQVCLVMGGKDLRYLLSQLVAGETWTVIFSDKRPNLAEVPGVHVVGLREIQNFDQRKVSGPICLVQVGHPLLRLLTLLSRVCDLHFLGKCEVLLDHELLFRHHALCLVVGKVGLGLYHVTYSI